MDWRTELSKPIFLDESGRRITLGDSLQLPSDRVRELFEKQSAIAAKPKRVALQDGQFKPVHEDEIDFDLPSSDNQFGTHANLIPLQSAVAGPRIFYGARFANQALPVVKPEAPWVQSAIQGDPDGRSFDEVLGESSGAIRAKRPGRVVDSSPDHIDLEYDDGEKETLSLHNKFPFNRKTCITQSPVAKPGDIFKPGQLLARSNFTDDKGTLAMGINARVGLVPYYGYSMDDAVVVSEAFAKRMASNKLYGYDTEFKRGVKGGKAHYTGIFPQKFTRDQLDNLDEDGVVLPGTRLKPGDPFILATRPRVISSTSAQLGQLSKHMRNARTDAVSTWDQHHDGIVTDVKKTRNGVRVNIETDSPTEAGDKLVFRSGNKGVVSKIIPDNRMPRTADGRPLEVLLNPLSLPSRVNDQLPYEMLLGKVAEKNGTPYKLPGFNKPNEKWYDFVAGELAKSGLSDVEDVFDPGLNRKLENPIMVGNAYLLKLMHESSSKMSVRGQGSYNADQIPSHGGGENAKAKRLSGLETNALLSSGAYNVIREGATLRGQKNDEYWRQLRSGHEPKEPGSPFVWDKFKALLSGTGYIAKHLPSGEHRLTFFTDRDLDKQKPVEIDHGDLVDLATLEPAKRGLFQPALTGGNKWGAIRLPKPLPNPAAESVILKLLGLTRNQYREVLAGRMEMPDQR